MLLVVQVFPPSAPTHLSLISQIKAEDVSAFQKVVGALSGGDFVDLLSRKNMLALIVFAGLMGWATFAAGHDGDSFRKHLASGNAVMMKLIGLLMKIAPIGLFIYFANLAVQMGPQIWAFRLKQLSERKKVKNPAQSQTDYHEFSKYFKSVEKSILVGVFCNGAENYRSENREYSHYQKMSQDFLPTEISKASSIAR